jgi:CRP-like cAMP-binding protein
MLGPDKINYYLSLFRDITLDDLQHIIGLATPRQLSAGEIYIRPGSSQNKLAYITQGIIRVYYVKDSGEEFTVLLRWEDQFFSSYDSTLFHQPSRFTYEALEDTQLLETDFNVLMDFLDQDPRLARTKQFFLLDMLAEAMHRVESFVLLSPEERYLAFIQEKPDIIQRVPGKYLASLLGVTPVSLSRIRSRIASKPIPQHPPLPGQRD